MDDDDESASASEERSNSSYTCTEFTKNKHIVDALKKDFEKNYSWRRLSKLLKQDLTNKIEQKKIEKIKKKYNPVYRLYNKKMFNEIN